MVHTGPHGISCALVETHKNRLYLKAYYSFSGDMSTITVRDCITEFTQKNKLKKISLHIALSSPLLHESFVRLNHATPKPSDFINPTTKKLIWDYRYMHTLDTGEHLFYLCGMARHTLFHYQLMAHTLDLDMRAITSTYMAVINAYATLFEPTFRQSKLTADLIKSNYKLEESIDHYLLLQQLLIHDKIMLDIAKEKVSLLSIIGLSYFQQERFHATN